jgi:hypothetical protein
MQLREDVLHGPDVIEMAVGEEDGFDITFASMKTREIGDQIVDTEHIFIGELQTDVDDIEIAVDLDNEAVPSYLFESPERENP